MWARLASLLAVLGAILTMATSAFAFKPPPLNGHVMDTAGKLSQADIQYLDAKLSGYRQQTGFAIVAFIVGSLEGEPIDDVAYTTFNAWGVGEKGKDNGVLLVIAPNERKVRIETGKGVGGELTDLQSNDIIRQVIAPLLQQNRFREAIDEGTGAIAKALSGEAPNSPARGRVVAGGTRLRSRFRWCRCSSVSAWWSFCRSSRGRSDRPSGTCSPCSSGAAAVVAAAAVVVVVTGAAAPDTAAAAAAPAVVAAATITERRLPTALLETSFSPSIILSRRRARRESRA
ncbi:methanol dehydrogenase [Minicystis rosea]|nr:methanol dehydrogenase [Minicystis rosea]